MLFFDLLSGICLLFIAYHTTVMRFNRDTVIPASQSLYFSVCLFIVALSNGAFGMYLTAVVNGYCAGMWFQIYKYRRN